MKSPLKEKKDNIKTEDDTLFGLLSAYKIYNTYFRILINISNTILILQITSNPKKWPKIGEDKYADFRLCKRSEIGMIKLSVKYLSPDHLIDYLGPALGLKIPESDISIINNIESDDLYSLETKYIYLQEIIYLITKIIELSPEKKYEIIEKFLSKII